MLGLLVAPSCSSPRTWTPALTSIQRQPGRPLAGISRPSRAGRISPESLPFSPISSRPFVTQKAKHGLWPAKAPIGYLNVREQVSAKSGTAKVALDPERALLVREAFRLYATGDYSLADLQGALHAKGLASPTARKPGAPPPVSALATMLQNPFYVGVVEWDGVQYPGRHKPLFERTSSSAARRRSRHATRPGCASASTTTT